MPMLRVGRPSTDSGALRRLKVHVDDVEVAAIRPGNSVDIPIAPGSHSLVGRMDWASSTPADFHVDGDDVVTFVVSLPGSAIVTSFIRPSQAVQVRQVL